MSKTIFVLDESSFAPNSDVRVVVNWPGGRGKAFLSSGAGNIEVYPELTLALPVTITRNAGAPLELPRPFHLNSVNGHSQDFELPECQLRILVRSEDQVGTGYVSLFYLLQT